jgi:hypothetical protein
MITYHSTLVIPAKAGIQGGQHNANWIPAFAGMTNLSGNAV